MTREVPRNLPTPDIGDTAAVDADAGRNRGVPSDGAVRRSHICWQVTGQVAMPDILRPDRPDHGHEETPDAA